MNRNYPGLSVVVSSIVLSCGGTLKEVTLASYRVVYDTDPNAEFIQDYSRMHGCIGVAQRRLFRDQPSQIEERAALDYAEHCGDARFLQYDSNGDVTIAYNPGL